MQTAVRAIYHDHCYVMPHKQGATSLLFPAVSGLNTRIQGGKVVVVTSPDILPTAHIEEDKQEEEELNEGIAHDHGYYHSTSGSEESQDEKPEGGCRKSSIALDLPTPTKGNVAIAFGPTSSNMSFPDCQLSTLPAQIFAQDEEEAPQPEGQTKLELNPETTTPQYSAEQAMRMLISKEVPDSKKRQRKTSVNTKPPPEPVVPLRKGTRQRKPSTKVKEMLEEAEEKEKEKKTPRKRKAVISIARQKSELELAIEREANLKAIQKGQLLAEALLSANPSQTGTRQSKASEVTEGATLKKVKKLTEGASSQKSTPKRIVVKKKKGESLIISTSVEDRLSQDTSKTKETQQVLLAKADSSSSFEDTKETKLSPKSLTHKHLLQDQKFASPKESKEKPLKLKQVSRSIIPADNKSEIIATGKPQKEPQTEQKTASRLGKSKASKDSSTLETTKDEKKVIEKPEKQQESDLSKEELKSENQKKAETEEKVKGRGRPRKEAEESLGARQQQELDPKTAARRGKARRNETDHESVGKAEKDSELNQKQAGSEDKKKTPGRRGRQRKSESVEDTEMEIPQKDSEPEQKSPRGRGRPRKYKIAETGTKSEESCLESKTPAKQGRPKKIVSTGHQDDHKTKENDTKIPDTQNDEEPKTKRVKQTLGDGKEFTIITDKSELSVAKSKTDNLENLSETSEYQPQGQRRGRGRPPKQKGKDDEESVKSSGSRTQDSNTSGSTIAYSEGHTGSTRSTQKTRQRKMKDNGISTPSRVGSRGRSCRQQSSQKSASPEPVKRGQKRKPAEITAYEEVTENEELTIRFIPNGDITKSGNHWGQAITSDLLLRVFQQVIAVEGPFPFLARASKICRLWYEVGRHPSLWKTVDLTAECIKKYKKSLVSLCRHRLSDATTTLNLSGWTSLSDADMEMVIKHCKNLEILNLSGCSRISSVSVDTLATHCKQLTSIDFSEAWPSKGQHEKSTESLSHLVETLGTRLRSLSLSTTAMADTEVLLDALMLHCPNLEHLDLSNCLFSNILFKLPLERLQEACPNICTLLLGNSLFQVKEPTNKELSKCPGFVHLKTLDISRGTHSVNKFRYVTDDVLKRLVRNSFDLENINLSGCRHITPEGIEALPIVSLKKLGLASCRAVTQPNIVDIILKWAHSLRHLNLSGNSLDEQSTLRLIDGCPNLTCFDLSGCRGLPSAMRRQHVGDDAISELRRMLSRSGDD